MSVLRFRMGDRQFFQRSLGRRSPMADRLFALFALIAGGIYTYVAFFIIKAPFQ